MTDIIAFQEGREARIDGKPRDARRNADWLHGWDTVDMQERLSEQSAPTPEPHHD
jgi:hypothetical protein